MEPVIGQGPLDDAVAAHPPVPFSTARRHFDLVPGDPQGEQMTATRAGTFPLLPVAAALTTTWPASVFGRCVRHAVGAFPFGSALPDIKSSGFFVYTGLFQPGDFHPIYNAPILGAHNTLHTYKMGRADAAHLEGEGGRCSLIHNQDRI